MLNILEKQQKLKTVLESYKSVVIAYSGGTDSNYLLYAAKQAGIKTLAVTFASSLYPTSELERAVNSAKKLGVAHKIIATDPLSIDDVRYNRKMRCYACKKHLFGTLVKIAAEEGYAFVLDGSNLDDISDHRPGRIAAQELGVQSPLEVAQLTKSDIRQLSKEAELATWNIPSFACYASRFPYDTEISTAELAKTAQAEEALHELGLLSARVRCHGTVARIETDDHDFDVFIKNDILRKKIDNTVKSAGFLYVSVDLDGYKTGSMNKTIDITK